MCIRDRLDILNLNFVVNEILQTTPAIKKHGLEAGLLRFHLEEIEDLYEELIHTYSPKTNAIVDEAPTPTAPPLDLNQQTIPKAFTSAPPPYTMPTQTETAPQLSFRAQMPGTHKCSIPHDVSNCFGCGPKRAEMVEMFYKWLDTIPNPEKATSPPEFGMI